MLSLIVPLPESVINNLYDYSTACMYLMQFYNPGVGDSAHQPPYHEFASFGDAVMIVTEYDAISTMYSDFCGIKRINVYLIILSS